MRSMLLIVVAPALLMVHMLLPRADPGDLSRPRRIRDLLGLVSALCEFLDSPIRKEERGVLGRGGRSLHCGGRGDGGDARPRLVGFADTFTDFVVFPPPARWYDTWCELLHSVNQFLTHPPGSRHRLVP